MTTTDSQHTTVTAFTVVQAIDPGQRVRVTWPTGFTRVGVIGRLRFGPDDELATHDGDVVTGGYTDAVRVETMGDTGRYTTTWTRPAPS